MNKIDIRHKATREAKRLGASIVGYAPVSRWDDHGEVPIAYRPKSVWSGTETVIVLGVPILLPIIESTPSINYQEMYNTANQLLDRTAYLLAVFLNNLGYASIFIPRDGYGNLEILRRNPIASFSHAYAGKYAGMGTIGMHHMLLTPEYGPRLRLVSVFTSATIKGSQLHHKELCTKCGQCVRLCPVKAFKPIKGQIVGEMCKDPCTERHQMLRTKNCWPCGICAKVCPIGSDRVLYKRRNANYALKSKMSTGCADIAPFSEWEHMRAHGSEEVRNE
jgi:epoxyqueuosine reductase